jgi:hypothetical protein
VPTGAIVCVPICTSVDVVVCSEPLTEQPFIVSQWLEVDVPVVVVLLLVVVVTEKMVEYVHNSAVLVWHSGSLSVVI